MFVSGRDLTGGAVWFEELRRQLEAATAIISVISHYSKDSRWVHFESGAGFTRSCTIPLAVGDITIDTLGAPMKLLQARNLDRTGLESLTDDVARMAGIRKPNRYPGIDEALQTINEFLNVRKTPTAALPEKRRSKQADIKIREDANIRRRVDAVRKKARDLTIQSVVSRSATFEIPSIPEMQSMELRELMEIAEAIGISLPFASRVMLNLFTVPPANSPEWKKINELKTLEAMEKDWADYEASLAGHKS